MKDLISSAFKGERDHNDPEVVKAVEQTINDLDLGNIRVCEKKDTEWKTNAWVKEAILLYFRIAKMDLITTGDINYFDKVPLKKWNKNSGVRVVPHALARRGSYIEDGAILMPSYINIGAYVSSGTMVDTWATVGSCAQIGRNVHLSGGVGIGGVLEPVQATPVIIEDHAFIGSRCIVVEGAVIEEGAVLGAGVTVTASSRVIDVTGAKEVVHRGRVPKNAVVISGSSPKQFPSGTYNIQSALIIGYRNEGTDKKTSLTSALRDFNVSA